MSENTNTNTEETKAVKVPLELNEQNIPIWRDKNNNVIRELKREHFFNEHLAKENKEAALRSFYDYMHCFKLVKATEAQAKLDALARQAEEYALKRDEVGVELDVRASLLGLTTSGSRNPDEHWVDGVIAVRIQYGHDNGWGVSAWADIGDGSDSSSYQLFGIVSYRFKSNIRIFGGYRIYHLEYSGHSGGRRFDLDLDYTGPMIGVAYRF